MIVTDNRLQDVASEQLHALEACEQVHWRSLLEACTPQVGIGNTSLFLKTPPKFCRTNCIRNLLMPVGYMQAISRQICISKSRQPGGSAFNRCMVAPSLLFAPLEAHCPCLQAHPKTSHSHACAGRLHRTARGRRPILLRAAAAPPAAKSFERAYPLGKNEKLEVCLPAFRAHLNALQHLLQHLSDGPQGKASENCNA